MQQHILHHLVLVLSILYAIRAEADGVTINTPFGKIRGHASPKAESVSRFLAIPYADYPQRFQQAKHVTPWKG